jgi:hypothetical protein
MSLPTPIPSMQTTLNGATLSISLYNLSMTGVAYNFSDSFPEGENPGMAWNRTKLADDMGDQIVDRYPLKGAPAPEPVNFSPAV